MKRKAATMICVILAAGFLAAAALRVLPAVDRVTQIWFCVICAGLLGLLALAFQVGW